MIVSLSAEARNDLKRIYRFGKRFWGVERARRFARELKSSTDNLAKHPFLGSVRDGIGQHIRVFVHRDYLAYYMIDESAKKIIILRIMHGRELPPEL